MRLNRSGETASAAVTGTDAEWCRTFNRIVWCFGLLLVFSYLQTQSACGTWFFFKDNCGDTIASENDLIPNADRNVTQKSNICCLSRAFASLQWLNRSSNHKFLWGLQLLWFETWSKKVSNFYDLIKTQKLLLKNLISSTGINVYKAILCVGDISTCWFILLFKLASDTHGLLPIYFRIQSIYQPLVSSNDLTLNYHIH